MTKNEIIAKVKELIAAPMCNPELRAAAEAYLNDQSKANIDSLLNMLDKYVSSLDETLAFAESDTGKKVFGEETAANMVKLGRELKAKDEKYCFCPACQAGAAIYANKESL